MDIALFWSIFVVLSITYFAIAIGASRPLNIGENFFFAHRRFGFMPIALSLAATQIGAGLVLGSSQEGYRFGILGMCYSLGIGCGLLIMSVFIVQKLRKNNIKTISEFFQVKYKSAGLRKAVSVLSILSLSGILTSQIIASRLIIESTIGHHSGIVIVFWLMVIGYTVIGGFRAVVATNIIQLAVVLSVFLIAFFLLKLKPILPTTIHAALAYDARFDFADWSRFSSLFFLPLGYCVIGQDLAQRFFSARGPRSAAFAALFAAFIIIVFALIPVLIGFDARINISNTPMSGYLLLDYIRTRLEPFFYYLIVCAVIAAISSTADAALCALGSNFVEDFSLSTLLPYGDKSLGVFYSRVLIFLVGLGALIVSYQSNDILWLLSLSYELSVSLILVPFLGAVLLKQPKLKAAIFSMLCAAVALVIFHIVPAFAPRELVVFGISTLAFVVAHLIFPVQQT